MVRFVTLTIALLALSLSAMAQDVRRIDPSESIETVRPEGEFRSWSFFSKQKTFGQLRSLGQGRIEIYGQQALIFKQQLDIDFTLIGQDRKVHSEGESYFALDGTYLGCRMDLGREETASRLELERNGNRLEGFFTRGGQERDVSLEADPAILAWEADFADQLEILLSQQTIAVGDSLVDSVLQPHSMFKTRIAGTVLFWMWQEIYKGKIDSVFIIKLTEPQDYQLYFTADKKLVRVDIINQDIRLFQDIIPVSSTADDVTAPISRGQSQPGSRLTLRTILFKSPHYVAFVFALVLSLVLLARRGLTQRDSYLAAAAGMISFVVVPFVQQPIQEFMIMRWLAPAMAAGESALALGIMPALVGALIQTATLLFLVYAVIAWRKPVESSYAIVGAFVAGGFGLIEAFYVSGLAIRTLFAWPLLERTFFILFHVSIGSLLGLAVRLPGKKLVGMLALFVALNTILRYLPLLVVHSDVPVELLHFVIAFFVLAIAAGALMVHRSGKRARQ